MLPWEQVAIVPGVEDPALVWLFRWEPSVFYALGSIDGQGFGAISSTSITRWRSQRVDISHGDVLLLLPEFILGESPFYSLT
ncbi:MAG: hypothetical protein ACJAYU_004981 [Bradymonadia bacterium]